MACSCAPHLASQDAQRPIPTAPSVPASAEPSGEAPADRVRALLAEHVPEIRSGTVVVKAIARVVGRRTKVALAAADGQLDPIAVAVGPDGARIRQVVAGIDGEAIDLVPWDADAARFVTNAVAPVNVVRIQVDEEAHAMTLFVADADLTPLRDVHLALAAELVGWRLVAAAEPAPEDPSAAQAAPAPPPAAP